MHFGVHLAPLLVSFSRHFWVHILARCWAPCGRLLGSSWARFWHPFWPIFVSKFWPFFAPVSGARMGTHLGAGGHQNGTETIEFEPNSQKDTVKNGTTGNNVLVKNAEGFWTNPGKSVKIRGVAIKSQRPPRLARICFLPAPF